VVVAEKEVYNNKKQKNVEEEEVMGVCVCVWRRMDCRYV